MIPTDPAAWTVVIPAPGAGPGHWAGAADVVLEDGSFWLAYRVRYPVEAGRGVGVVVARSGDGVSFEEVARIDREAFGAESFERPALVRLDDGRWRVYLSCATPGSKHWWVDSLTAGSPEALPTGERHLTVRGDDTVGVKDPVVRRSGAGWVLYLCCHPLTEAGHEDRMTTRLLRSDDGLAWTDHGVVLEPRPGHWDARGARLTTVVPGSEPLTVTYDGRPDAASNWYETTGAAVWDGTRFVPTDADPLRSPYSDGALRYAVAVPLPGGGTRWYAEVARPDGAHDLVTALDDGT